jgi:DNA-binding response OmpR family regulator
VRLLERGGDDMLVKPFSYPELRARIAACSGAPPPAGHSHSCSPARCVSILTTAACQSTSVRWSFQRSIPAAVSAGRRADPRVDESQL